MKARIECLHLRERAEFASTCWDTSRIRHGTIEDQSVDEYCNFLQTKLCCEILQLEGTDMSAQDETASDGLAAEQGEKTTPAACCREEQKGRNAGWTAE